LPMTVASASLFGKKKETKKKNCGTRREERGGSTEGEGKRTREEEMEGLPGLKGKIIKGVQKKILEKARKRGGESHVIEGDLIPRR